MPLFLDTVSGIKSLTETSKPNQSLWGALRKRANERQRARENAPRCRASGGEPASRGADGRAQRRDISAGMGGGGPQADSDAVKAMIAAAGRKPARRRARARRTYLEVT